MGWALVLVLVSVGVVLRFSVFVCLPPFPHYFDSWEGGHYFDYLTSLFGPSVGFLPLKHLYYGVVEKPERKEFYLRSCEPEKHLSHFYL